MTTHSTTELDLADDVRESLLRLAEEQKRSASDVLREMLLRDARRQATVEALAKAEAGGPFVEWDDFKDRARARIAEMKERAG